MHAKTREEQKFSQHIFPIALPTLYSRLGNLDLGLEREKGIGELLTLCEIGVKGVSSSSKDGSESDRRCAIGRRCTAQTALKRTVVSAVADDFKSVSSHSSSLSPRRVLLHSEGVFTSF